MTSATIAVAPISLAVFSSSPLFREDTMTLEPSLIKEIDMNRFHEMMEINLFRVFFGSKHALIQMEKQKSGLIVTILSTAALKGRENSSAYCASKSAAHGFVKVLKIEAEKNNIKVMSIFPGGMQTNFFDEDKPQDYLDLMDPKSVADKVIENLKKENPEEELIIKRPGK